MGLVNTLARHPPPLEAHFEFSLALTYALPRTRLAAWLPPGLELDAEGDLGFVAVDIAQTRRLRPAFFPPFWGIDSALVSYRLFVRLHTPAGRWLRGLHPLRCDTNHRVLQHAGNALAHQRYQHARIVWRRDAAELHASATTPDAEADLAATVFCAESGAPALPPASPFHSWQQARDFTQPAPPHFRSDAPPHRFSLHAADAPPCPARAVRVAVDTLTFLQPPAGPASPDAAPRLACAFLLENIAYHWSRGTRERLGDEPVFAPSPTA